MSKKTAADYARDALYGHSAFAGGTLQAVEAEIAAAEERGRDELRAALTAAEKDRDTWKRLCETADAQATAATIRANKLADKRGYDIDDDAEERGRCRGVEEAIQRFSEMAKPAAPKPCVLTTEEIITELQALAPHDSAPTQGTHCTVDGCKRAYEPHGHVEPRDSGKEG